VASDLSARGNTSPLNRVTVVDATTPRLFHCPGGQDLKPTLGDLGDSLIPLDLGRHRKTISLSLPSGETPLM
jgi:hypothetical protein